MFAEDWKGWGKTRTEHGMGLLGDDNKALQLIAVIMTQLFKYTRNGQIVHFQWYVNMAMELQF